MLLKDIENEFEKPVKIFRDPLKSVIPDETEWRYD